MGRRLDPRIKILVVLVVMVVTFAISDWLFLAGLLAGVGVALWIGKISLVYCLNVLRLPALFILLMVVADGFLTRSGDVILGIGIFQLTDANLLRSLMAFMRLVIVILSAVVLIKTTKSYEFMLAMEAFVSPLKKAGMQTDGFLLTLKIVGRFIPTLTMEAQKILNAQASRGLDIKHTKLLQKVKIITALLIPVFVISMKRGDQLADAMSVRGYVLNEERSSYRSLKSNV